MTNRTHWTEEADVVIIGYGGAGAVGAIAAHDAGAKVLVLEKQPQDTPTRTRHTPSARMSGGSRMCPDDPEKLKLYMEGLARITNETLDPERKKMLSVFAESMVGSTDWMKKAGIEMDEDKVKMTFVDFPELPGSDCAGVRSPKPTGRYRNGAAFFKALTEAVRRRGIEVMWEASGEHLVTEHGEVKGVIARQGAKQVFIRARQAVILACGGFEFNQSMKENYLRVNPAYFYGNPGNTGDGVNMAIEVGAALWHMNNASWRVIMKFPDFPIAFATQRHETASILVDKRGRRFTNERFKMHAFGYELINYDCYAMCYPKVPCFWIFDETRRALAPLASVHGACNPPGGIMGDIHYIWSEDNRKEVDRGWIMKADTIEELAGKIAADPDDNGLMSPSTLRETRRKYNEYCRKGEDLEFNKSKEWLQSLENPPYYAVKLWPGGPNTQGGPKRNERAQVLRPDHNPVPGLYAAGELGSVWGMVYQGGGNLAECLAFGRIAGTHAASEKRR